MLLQVGFLQARILGVFTLSRTPKARTRAQLNKQVTLQQLQAAERAMEQQRRIDANSEPQLHSLSPADETACSALLARIEGMDVRKVAASTQYGMGLVIVVEGAKHLLNGIAYRNDEMTHADRVALAEKANAILRTNTTAPTNNDHANYK